MSVDVANILAALHRVTDADLRDLVGDASLRRGRTYAAQHRVTGIAVPEPGLVAATVRGQGRVYRTEVQFSHDGIVLGGECTCPIGGDCKHVVAVVIAARQTLGHSPAGVARSALSGAAPAPARPAAWESLLGAMVSTSDAGSQSTPLGLLVEVRHPRTGRYSADPSSGPKLALRPVVPGKTGWVRTGISWTTLEYYGYASTRLDQRHKQAAQHLAMLDAGHRYYSQPDWLSLDGLGEGWPMALRRCRQAGVALLTDQRKSGEVVIADEPATVAFDLVRTTDGSVQVTPSVALPEEFQDSPAEPDDAGWFTIGNPPTGLWRMRGPDILLAAFDPPVDAHTARVLQHRVVDVPAPDVARFLATTVPALTRRFRVGSPDGSVEVAEVAAPRIRLRATHRPGHRLDLDWSFVYSVGDLTLALPLDSSEHAAIRDADAEAGLLAAVTAFGLPPQAVVVSPHGVRVGPLPRSTLTGFDVVAFLDHVLPRLELADGVDVVVDGDPVTYTEATQVPTVRLALAESDDPDWFDLNVEVSVAGEAVPIADLITAFTLGQEQVILPTGTWFRVDRPELAELHRLVEEAQALQDDARGPLRLSPYHADLWAELETLGVVREQSDRWVLLVKGLTGSSEALSAPAGLEASLRPYQHEGFEWLTFLRRHGLGGILADDMGLGKTVQGLAMILQERADTARGPDGDRRPDAELEPWLVVAPTSVMATWAAEAARFAPSLRVVVLAETATRRGALVADAVAGADVVVTSYAVFRLDAEAFRAIGWAGLILDEAQAVKNHQSVTYQCARRLPARSRFAVTGTPMENNLMELWSLLSIVAPGLFPSPKSFTEHFRRPIENGSAPDRLDTLRRRIRPVMLRRTKQAVAADLPPKQEQVIRVDLPSRHRRLYDRGLARERQRVLGLLEDANRNRIAIFRALTLLRRLSLHPGLVDDEHRAVPCAKIDTLLELMEPVLAEGHQALVFSQFTSFLALVRERLDAAGVSYSYLDGRTRRRGEAIEAFRSGDRQVFLISLKAGGVGLTLTEADYVFLLDPWWNPAVEAQAVDRTHRIGQDKPVNVYRLVSAETIEEKVVALQERKRELFATVVDEGAMAGGSLTSDDIRSLL